MENKEALYEIKIEGQIDRRRLKWFEGMEMVQDSDGNTLLTGRISDQAALAGILNRIMDVGIHLISVRQI